MGPRARAVPLAGIPKPGSFTGSWQGSPEAWAGRESRVWELACPGVSGADRHRLESGALIQGGAPGSGDGGPGDVSDHLDSDGMIVSCHQIS